ncbi:SRPBCC family protein [Flavobacterium sp. SM2513]|uniref:SRPBCC family protein n=1 Tax=Flavobacterium sp. SM2513 TaxID=3424766 RepID=UPI003D7F6BB2
MNTTEETQNHSKGTMPTGSAVSGTNPDRYSSSHTVEEAEQLSKKVDTEACKSLIPGVNANVSNLERMIMVAAGGYMLYNALSGSKKNMPQSIAATAMLARGITGYCPVYNAVGKVETMKSSNVNIRTSISIDKPVDEVYAFWRKLENLPKFMSHLKTVEQRNDSHSHWVAQGPAGIGTLSWDAKVLMDEPSRILSWTSLPGSTVDNAGKVVFKQRGSHGTDLEVTISYHAPLGVAGEAAAKLLNPLFERMVKSDIENLKSYLETGTVANV